MSMSLKDGDRRFTYADYVTWPDDERWEIIDGVPYDMTPAPSRLHQEVLGELHRQFATHFLGKKCRVYIAPFDVMLPQDAARDDEITTVVQPDLVVVCDETKLVDAGCKGAPDLLVEVLSPSTARKDMREKLALYERVGVREYWVVHPHEKAVEVFRSAEGGHYGKPEVFAPGDELTVGFLEELVVDLVTVFRV